MSGRVAVTRMFRPTGILLLWRSKLPVYREKSGFTAWVKVESVKCEDRLIFAQLLIVLVRKHRLQHRHFDTSVLQFWHSPCWKLSHLNLLRNKKILEVPVGAFNKVTRLGCNIRPVLKYINVSLNWGTLKSPLNYRRTIPWYAHF